MAHLRALLALALLLPCAWASRADAAPEAQKSVLILLPGQPGLPAATVLAAGIRSVLVSAWSTSVTIETEHVDVARFQGAGDEAQLRDLYRRKFPRPFDVIVAAAGEPLGFLLRARDDLWPGTPIVACAIDARAVGALGAPPGLTVITVTFDMEGTLRAALALLPRTRHVALIGGASAADQGFNELGRGAVRALGDRLDLIDLTGLPLGAALARAAALPEDTVALVSGFQVDGAGRRFYGVEIVGAISSTANRPLFSIFGTVMGLGIVGGSLIDLQAVGREAGELALRVLRGEAMPASPVRSAGTNGLAFDWRELSRWGLADRPLPPGSRVLYRPPTLWAQYRWHVVGAAVVLVAQGALIVGLLVEGRRRRHAQEGLAARLRFEALVADVSATFAASPPSRVDDDIRDCLRRIAVLLGVDRGTLWQPGPDGTTFLATHSWSAGASAPPPPSLATSAFPLAQALGEARQSLSFSSPDELPPDAVAERRAFAQLGVRSLLAVPLRIDDRRLGILAFANLRARRAWPAEIVREVRTLAEIFANALMRKHAAAELQLSEALSSAVLTALPGEAAIVDGEGVVVQVNEAWAALTVNGGHGALAVPALGESYLAGRRAAAGAALDDGPARARDLVEAVVRGRRDDGVVEYASRGGDEERWFELRAQRLAPPARGAAVMHLDVTHRKRAEVEAQRHLREMAHMNRVAAMGELASSLAHELNQPLAAILSNAQAATQFLAAAPADLAEVRDCLGDIVRSDRRAAEVIRRMRRLLQQGAVDLSPADLNELAQSVLPLVASDARLHQVAVEFTPAPALPAVRVDPVQIQQVILNLLLNAIAAAAQERARPGRVRVQTSLAEAGVEVEVRDSGPGIAGDDRDRIFEPFFTTKREGLGMGLAISRSIVKAHGGRVWVEDAAEGGARFRVRLPAA